MKKSIAHYISDLLYLHDCVIIPEFGGLVGNPISAKIDKKTGIISPPSKQILFNVNLKTNDGLLISHIANQEGISQKIATKYVSDFVSENKQKLKKSRILRVEKIGLFNLNREDKIVFTQDIIANYNLASFGMKTILNKGIERKKLDHTNNAKIKHIEFKKYDTQVLLKVAAIIIPLLTLSFFAIEKEKEINNTYIQMAELISFKEFKKNAKQNLKIEKSNVDKIEVTKKEPKSIDWEQIAKDWDSNNSINKTKKAKKIEKITIIDKSLKKTRSVVKKQYHIIAGAFANKNNANRMLINLQQKNYKAAILKGKRLHRVSYSSFANKEDAVLALRKIKKINKSAWLLTE